MQMVQYSTLTWDKLIHKMRKVSGESATFEKMAVYVEKNYKQMVFMTAEQAAGQAGISQGSVSKFCKFIGFQGYTDFQKHLQKIVSETITAPQRLAFTHSSSYQSDDLLVMEAQNIMQLKEIVQGESYQEMVDNIVKARQVVLLSARISATLLPYLKYALSKLRDGVEIVTPESEEWGTLPLRNKEDLFILTIGFPRYATVLIDKIKELRAEKFHMQAITDSQLSPISVEAENTIYIPLTVSSINDMYSTPIAFFNLLVRDVTKKIPNLEERLAAIEQYDSEHNCYYKI